MLLAVHADAVGCHERHEQMIVKLEDVIGGEAAPAHVLRQRAVDGEGTGRPDKFISHLGMHAIVGTHVIVGSERHAQVIPELILDIDRETA